MNRGSGFARKVYEPAPTPAPRRAERAGVYVERGDVVQPRPKTQPKRNRTLLDMAQGRPCLLLFPWVQEHRPDTVVACHSNMQAHGKAGARKADDQYSVWGCGACHWHLDQGPASAEVKSERFMAALTRQVDRWQQIVGDMSEPPRFRSAAAWALAQINGAKA